MSGPGPGTGDGGSGRRGWVEVVSAVLLSVAALAIAWSGYQASRWTGEQAKAFSRANAARVESTRWSNLANTQTEIDVATFTQWVDAYARNETMLADFYRKRFRPEFKPAVEAWIASRPLQNPEAPLTPFATPQYRLAARAESERLEAKAPPRPPWRTATSSGHQLRPRRGPVLLRAVLRRHQLPHREPRNPRRGPRDRLADAADRAGMDHHAPDQPFDLVPLQATFALLGSAA